MVLALLLGVIAGAGATAMIVRGGAWLDVSASCRSVPLDAMGDGPGWTVNLEGTYGSGARIDDRPGEVPIILVLATPPGPGLGGDTYGLSRALQDAAGGAERAAARWLKGRALDLGDYASLDGRILVGFVMNALEGQWSSSFGWLATTASEQAADVEVVLFDVDGHLVEHTTTVVC